ncbi:hypothetical protein ABZ490_16700 [Streptomyces sp. NPDC005811]|uniref:WD40 repeat domain-containing protein n=1 Tax=Streptomyces sp. NPDC005811 TaxID=3154565 RepID=UPI0033C2498D
MAVGTLDGRPVAVTGADDRGVRVWDAVTGRRIGEALDGIACSARALTTGVVEGRGIVLVGSHDGTAWRADLGTGRPLGPPLRGHTDGVSAVALGTMAGRAVAVTGSRYATVRVWDAVTGEPIGEGPVFPDEVGAVAVTPDGRPAVAYGTELAVLVPLGPRTPCGQAEVEEVTVSASRDRPLSSEM